MYELEKCCFALPWNLRQCGDALAQKSFAAFGLWEKDMLIAYISLYHAAGEMEIVNLAVHPGRRRRSLGCRLLSLVLQVARKMGMQKASLEVRKSNMAAIALYEKMAFQKAGIRRRYYPDNGEDAIIYTLMLKPAKHS